MIDDFTTVGTDAPPVPGDFARNSQGAPWVAPVGGGRKVLYHRPSEWPFEDWSGVDMIQPKRKARRGESIPTLHRLIALETDGCVLWPFGSTPLGYGLVHIDGVTHYTHRLALELRVGPPPAPKMHAAHGPCHNPTCMNYRHLRWATAAENLADRKRDGTDDDGAKNVCARLTEQDVIDIRASSDNNTVLARQYGVSRSTISCAKRGITYREVAA